MVVAVDRERTRTTRRSLMSRRGAPQGHATIASTVANLVNNLVGAGLLSLPWALQRSSILSGSIMLAFIAAMTVVSFHMLVLACDALPHDKPLTFLALGKQGFGERFGILVQSIMLCSTYLSCISYILLACDFIGGDGGILKFYFPESEQSFFRNRYFIALCISIFILLPMSFVKELHMLRYTSALATFSLLLFLFLMVGAFFDITSRNNTDTPKIVQDDDIIKFSSSSFAKISPTVSWFGLNEGIFNAEPVMNVAFLCHYNIPRFYSELSDRTPGTMLLCSLISIGFCLFIYIAVGYLGAFTFGCASRSDLLESFASGYKPAILARLIMIFVVLATYPIVLHSLRESTISLLSHFFSQSTFQLEKHRWNTITLVLMCATVVPGATFRSIGKVLDFKGALFGSFIAFILLSVPSNEQPPFILRARGMVSSEIPEKEKTTSSDQEAPTRRESVDSGSSNSSNINSNNIPLNNKALIQISFVLIIWGTIACICGTAMALLSADDEPIDCGHSIF